MLFKRLRQLRDTVDYLKKLTSEHEARISAMEDL